MVCVVWRALLTVASGTQFSTRPEEDGSPFYIKGVTWRGAEGGEDKAGETSAPPHGLRQRDLDSLLRELARNKFNALRLTVNNLAMLRNELVQDVDFDRELNPSLVGQRYLSMLRVVAERAAAHGLLVVVAATRLAPGLQALRCAMLRLTIDALSVAALRERPSGECFEAVPVIRAGPRRSLGALSVISLRARPREKDFEAIHLGRVRHPCATCIAPGLQACARHHRATRRAPNLHDFMPLFVS